MNVSPASAWPVATVQVLDPGPRAALSVEDLPMRALQLACARCGRTVSAHGGRAPDCDGFVRPHLPEGYAYVDELRAGDHFRFLSRSSNASVRTAEHPPFDLAPDVGLLQVQSSAPDAADVVHLVQANTIVHREEAIA